MAGQVKSLSREKNNSLWEWYLNYKLPTAIQKNIELGKDEKKAIIDAKLSVNNYKAHLRTLESEINNDFEKITIEQIQNINPKSQSFVHGFYLDCITNGNIKPCIEVILYLIPQCYRKLVQIIME